MRVPFQHRAAGGWPRGWVVPAGSHVDRRVLPRSIPHAAFARLGEVPIGPYGFAQGTVAGGTVTVSIGPAGAGTSWELAQASIATTSGATDTSTCALFIQPAGTPNQNWQAGFSYSGGSDQIGLAGYKMVPGERLYAVWSSAKNGDVASLIVSGLMRALI